MKLTVFFIGDPVFDTKMFPGYEVAHVLAVDHYRLGYGGVRTSSVLNKFDDGSFETMNTIYKPYKEESNAA